ncbi:MAG: CotH kinase family protein, partial [Planctomycetes bacterium]|nr:CotH kinase family protein [Planctomycetota bacterium]
VVCHRRALFLAAYPSLDAGRVFGDYEPSLGDDGDEIVVIDALGAAIDAVRYSDRLPWPTAADGRGQSLQRSCIDAPSHLPENWGGGISSSPTPLAPAPLERCPPPQPAAATVVISEIHFHPARDDDEREEYVELHNLTAEPISLEGWRFTEGISFIFGAEHAIEPGGYLVLCRDAGYIRSRFGIENAVGDFSGQLSNRGERLELINNEARFVDAVEYHEQDGWPAAADGLGRSLEKVALAAPGSDPASWDRSRLVPHPEFRRVEVVGSLEDLVTQRFILGIDGVGEYIIDDVSLETTDDPGTSLLPGGDFEGSFLEAGWEAAGNSAGSAIEEGIGVDGSRGLRLISTGDCGGAACTSVDSVNYRFGRFELDHLKTYRLSLRYRYISGSSHLYALMLRGLAIPLDQETLTPGGANSVASDRPGAYISHIGRFPEEPTSSDSVWISARVRAPEGASIASVVLRYVRRDVEGEPEREIPLLDDGASGDGGERDGVYGGELGSFPDGSRVYFRIFAATDDGRTAISPTPLDTERRDLGESWGFYVNDLQPESVLPVYHLLIPRVDPSIPTDVNRFLNCTTLVTADFAFRGELYPQIGVRWRGNTACVIRKRNFKLRFNPGRSFRGVRKVNLQGIWTDKSLVREHLAWDFVRQVAAPYCETEFIRVHMNGAYHGLFLYLEHPDQRFLRRNGLDPDGYLYKASQPPRTDPGVTPIGVSEQPSPEDYAELWEKETREYEDLTPLSGFIAAFHEDARGPGGPTREFWQEHVLPEQLIGYQISQVVLNNIDSFAKNHFLYRESEADRWGFITWDMDLVFGKYFNEDAVGPGREVGTLNDCMLGDIPYDLNPWFSSTVLGSTLLNHMVDKFFLAGGGYYQRAYLVRLWDVVKEKYRNDVYDPIIDDLMALLDKEQADDIERWGRYPSNPGCEVEPDMATHVRIVKEQIAHHRESLVRFFDAHHRSVMTHPELKITELLPDPEGGDENLEFIELTNTTGRAIDISGWSVVGGIRYIFPEGAAVEKDEIILVVKNPVVFSGRYPLVAESRQVFGPYAGNLDDEGEALSVRDAGPGDTYPATVDQLEYGRGGAWPEARGGHSIELTGVRPDRDNDLPQNWRVSALPGGTPGSLVPLFVRGDYEANGSIDLTDAVRSLLYLFQGGGPPLCLDMADVNDDGAVQLTDPIYLLNYLFQAGAPPPPPFPEPGIDPTGDSLTCLAST